MIIGRIGTSNITKYTTSVVQIITDMQYMMLVTHKIEFFNMIALLFGCFLKKNYCLWSAILNCPIRRHHWKSDSAPGWIGFSISKTTCVPNFMLVHKFAQSLLKIPLTENLQIIKFQINVFLSKYNKSFLYSSKIWGRQSNGSHGINCLLCNICLSLCLYRLSENELLVAHNINKFFPWR